MAQYRKKPVVIEAVQLQWATWGAMCDLLGYDLLNGNVRAMGEPGAPIGLDIQTLEGVMHATQDDWVIRGIKGELYACKPDIFAATYEPA